MNPTSGQGGLLGVRPTVVIPQQQLQDLAANSHAPLQLLQQAHGGLAVESDVPTKRQRINDLSVGSDVTVLLQLQDNLAVAGESVLSKEESFEGRSVNLPSNEGRQHEASLQVIRRSLLDESRELIDHASKLRDVNAHLVNRAMKLWNEYAVLLNEHSSLSKENSSLSKENLSMVNQNGSLTKENISILKENSSLKKENISILKENSSLKKEHTYYKWRSMTGNKSFTFRRRRSASAAAAMPRRGSSYRYGGVSSSGYSSVRARPKLRYFLLGTAPTIGSAGLGAFTPSLFHAQVFEMFLALFNTGSNLST
ncbi:hypothetical protein QYE76_001354 [Lolium multiflorum]|uniref:Uncharacterized protein n=1 Tax=Lolium multiflorum TaxID=4521 RepID=A0AAD8RL59_LOLMU|nr:hypothetical protein QYE76_001354 [Lolium multiflorum]